MSHRGQHSHQSQCLLPVSLAETSHWAEDQGTLLLAGLLGKHPSHPPQTPSPDRPAMPIRPIYALPALHLGSHSPHALPGWEASSQPEW